MDLDAGLASVRGRGSVTVRRRGEEVVHESGQEFHVAQLTGDLPAAPSAAATPDHGAGDGEKQLAREVVALRNEANTLEKRAALVDPLVAELVRMRTEARNMGVYEVADRIRDRLISLGVEITDGPDGTTEFRLPD